jgi:hypothetical protein
VGHSRTLRTALAPTFAATYALPKVAIALVASHKVDAIVGGFSAGMFSALDRGLDFKVVGSMGASTGRDFFTALVMGARDLQTEARKRCARDAPNLAHYTGQKIDVLRKVPFYDWDPALAPPTKTLDGMQQASMEAGLVKCHDPIPDARLIDASLSRSAAP